MKSEILAEAHKEAEAVADGLKGMDPVHKGMVIGFITGLRMTEQRETEQQAKGAAG